MEIKLDYHRMAQMVYAMAALRKFETDEERIIGRHEEPALMRMFERALIEVALRLSPAVTSINASAATITLESLSPMAHQMLESAVTRMVLSDLHLSDEDPQTYIQILRAMTSPLPRLTQN